MSKDSRGRSFISDYSGPSVGIETLGGAPRSGSSKSPLEVWVVPITLAVLTLIGGAWASCIASETQRWISDRESETQEEISRRELDNQEEISRREIRAAQVRELAALTAILEGAGGGGRGAQGGEGPAASSNGSEPGSHALSRARYSVLAARLAGYGATAAPVLTEMLSWNLARDDQRAIERGLVYIGLQEDGSEAVGRAMEAVLRQEQLYPPPTHLSALRVLTSLGFREARDTLGAYRPEDRVLNWNNIESDEDQRKAFCETLDKARRAVGVEPDPERTADACSKQPPQVDPAADAETPPT